jgi:hypothetical protein
MNNRFLLLDVNIDSLLRFPMTENVTVILLCHEIVVL